MVLPEWCIFVMRNHAGLQSGDYLVEVSALEKIDFVIVGAGVVGLAIAAEIAKQCEDQSVIVLERHAKFGQETSSRNSEVIHAGMYYPAGSLKAQLCIEGNKLLYKFCTAYNIPYQRIGKLIIARDDSEVSAVEGILAQGKRNGVSDLEMLDRDQVMRLEPEISAVAAIYSPSTGIIDSHKLMAQLERMALQGSAIIAYNHNVTNVEFLKDGYQVMFTGPDGRGDSLACRWLINCAGLYADQIPASLGIDILAEGYKILPVKGEYFSISASKSKKISHLIYPPPLAALKGLGTHVTKSLDGRARLGPNAFNVSRMDDYDVDACHKDEFYQSVKPFLPFIEKDDLQPDMAGIRPKIQVVEGKMADFVVCHESGRGLPGLVNLMGIESPGLTASLALAQKVLAIINSPF
jgi:L-2-hydroxyglutarate oxidase LhgO